MKAPLFILCFELIARGACLAQSPDVIRIKGGAVNDKAVPVSSRYRYGQFTEGKILYGNGATAVARLNFNVLLGEVHFIDPNGDTLSLASEPVVRMVSMGPSVFWFDQRKDYLEILTDYGPVKLAVKHGLRMAKNEKLSGYDQSTGTSAVTTYQFYASGSTSLRKLAEKGDLVLVKSRTFFLIDQNNRAYPLNKTNLLKSFAKHRDQISAYLTANAVDFSKEEDLKKLLQYCSELL
ncbi:hypothetical protein [Spirosoma sp. KNUC1025]|uniref:hypothetical protein n=1 Tax=Spirosoma sp. KNUC1025 TaxID=2894082 RepID=UPI003863FD9B|nr:hypothetical protein LN737_16780 [Spirosoma sp. KNUC1025]